MLIIVSVIIGLLMLILIFAELGAWSLILAVARQFNSFPIMRVGSYDRITPLSRTRSEKVLPELNLFRIITYPLILLGSNLTIFGIICTKNLPEFVTSKLQKSVESPAIDVIAFLSRTFGLPGLVFEIFTGLLLGLIFFYAVHIYQGGFFAWAVFGFDIITFYCSYIIFYHGTTKPLIPFLLALVSYYVCFKIFITYLSNRGCFKSVITRNVKGPISCAWLYLYGLLPLKTKS